MVARFPVHLPPIHAPVIDNFRVFLYERHCPAPDKIGGAPEGNFEDGEPHRNGNQPHLPAGEPHFIGSQRHMDANEPPFPASEDVFLSNEGHFHADEDVLAGHEGHMV